MRTPEIGPKKRGLSSVSSYRKARTSEVLEIDERICGRGNRRFEFSTNITTTRFQDVNHLILAYRQLV